jgi:tetratricopeptide (TPR) repeat protein
MATPLGHRLLRFWSLVASVGLGLLPSCSTPPVSDAEREATRGAPTIVDAGSSAFAVTAADPEAKRLFQQGMQLVYAFEHYEAARSFRAAYARDAACSMCAWGVAYALSPNINATERRNEAEIRRYLAHARAGAGQTSAVEQSLIQALSVRYGDAAPDVQRSSAASAEAMCSTRPAEREVHPLERAYSVAMSEVVERFPDDPDVVTLYADAIMVTSAWEWWDAKTGAATGAMATVVERLHAARTQYPQHTGLAHFLVHASEQSPQPERAEGAADQLGKLAPGVPHLVHMPAHIFVHTGRFNDATRANEQALAVQKTYHEQITKAGFKPSFNWDFHHLHFLWYAALMEGRGDLAIGTARRMAERFGSSLGDWREYMRVLPLQTLVRLERWDEVLAEPAPREGLGLTEGVWHYARGVAFARTGRLDEANQSAREVARMRQLPTLRLARAFGRPMHDELMQMAAAVLDAEIVRARGSAATVAERTRAIEALQRAAALEDEIGGEPPRWAVSARLALADALHAAGRNADAEREYREHLRRQRENGWALRGLRDALRAQGNEADARALDQRLALAWTRADPILLAAR